jgi:hypothetical protein
MRIVDMGTTIVADLQIVISMRKDKVAVVVLLDISLLATFRTVLGSCEIKVIKCKLFKDLSSKIINSVIVLRWGVTQSLECRMLQMVIDSFSVQVAR